MTIRKLAGTVVTTVALLAVTVQAEAEPDYVGRIHGFMPQRSEDWDISGGLEFQARFWSSPSFAVAISAGVNSWAAKDEKSVSTDEFGTTTTSIYGNMSMIPIGASLLFKNKVSERVAVTLEGGVRYAFTDSNINAEYWYTDAEGTSYAKDRIVPDDPFFGLVGVVLESEIGDGLLFQCGFAYQFDLSDPHETFMGEDMGTTSFNSAMLNIGLAWTF